MARPGSTEPSGPLAHVAAGGQARYEPIVYTCSCGHAFATTVITLVDANREPAQAERATAGTLQSVSCSSCGSSSLADVPYAYHDERQRTCILVLPVGLRHRELEERAAFLLQLAKSGTDVPAHVRDF